MLKIVESLGRCGRHRRDPRLFRARFRFAVAHDGIGRHPELHRPSPRGVPPPLHVRDLATNRLDAVAMHDISVALLGDHRLGCFAFAPGVDRRARSGERLGLADRVLEVVAFAVVRKARFGPQSVDHRQPFAGARITVVMRIEGQSILGRLVRPPARHHVQRQPAVADIVDVGRLLGKQGGLMKIGPHRHHQLDVLRHRGQRRRGRPGIQRGLIDPLDVVEVQFRDQGQVPAGLLAALGQPPDIFPACGHSLIFDVAEPTAEYGHPVTKPHE